MPNNLICPISNEKIDSNVSQLTIFISVILVVAFIFTLQSLFLFIAAFDYFIRAFSSGKYSPLRFVAIELTKLFRWNQRMIDKAPKVFASRLGFLCLLASSILIVINMPVASIVIATISASLFLLDALGIVCVGCLIYHHIAFPYFNK